MKCVICHSDNIQMRDVMEEISSGNDIVRVPLHIPVCSQCGERYYDRKTMTFVENIKEKISKDKQNLKEVGHVLVWG